MTAIHSRIFSYFFYLYIYTRYVLILSQDVAKLPYCGEDVKHSEFILVSTLDGLMTSLKSTGDIAWQINTGPGPLLSSNIHQLELTNNGQWVRIIPSLSGSLYKFNGITIDPIPISADSLLTSSFRYSDDLLIAGGREVRTYGVVLNNGERLYECTLTGCRNTTNHSSDMDDIIIIERKTHTVRAVEPRTGIERWNFSVGQHNIKIPYISCIDMNLKITNLNISAILPEGLLIAKKLEKSEILWQHRFDAPIVAVWRWNGREVVPLNLFNSSILTNSKSHSTAPSIYVAMHNKQLYVHESSTMQNILQLQRQSVEKYSVAESQSLTQIPWKPIPAVSVTINDVNEESDDSTALSVLYASEYVNGNGYYLYSEDKTTCNNNMTNSTAIHAKSRQTFFYWWKEAFLTAITTLVICNIMYNYKIFGFGSRQVSDKLPEHTSNISNATPYSESKDVTFVSRYTMEFEPISCLGRGGFGVVFQAKKKFDECDYAVKRITLPNKPSAKNRMMREVKTLAKLDHRNIVRYYNAWLEHPPHGWQRQHDQQWLKDFSSYMDSSLNNQDVYGKNESSLAINIEYTNLVPYKLKTFNKKKELISEDCSSIIFEHSTDLQISETQGKSLDKVHSQNTFTYSAPAYLYIQMQLCCRESLKEWLNNAVDRNLSYTSLIFQQIVEAVEYVHSRGLIHRDLKPSNIFFSLEGQIKIGDFGLVTSIKEYDDSEDILFDVPEKKSYTNAVGTQLYMSPEQLKCQQYDYKVDIYSLGIIFFELLVSFKTEMERVTVLSDLRNHKYPNHFALMFPKEYELLNKMLSINPEKRPTATEIGKLLSKATTST